jgi:signal transduction histidine kinase
VGAGRTILRTGEEIRASVPGDRAALGVLFGHVLGAAARRAGTDGRITVELRLREHDAVVDVGPAGAEVPADGGRGVFEPSGRERGPEGRGDEGLGLPLARRIARAHGGDLRVAPAPGGGAVFRVTLPVVAAGSGGAG